MPSEPLQVRVEFTPEFKEKQFAGLMLANEAMLKDMRRLGYSQKDPKGFS